TANYFCSTLVDRIVSGYPTDRAEALQAELGFTDSLLVAGEQYHSWVIQRAGPVSDELPFSKTGLNVSFVDDLAPYREMKVRLLNGAHTSMVAVGYLAGLRLVKEVMDDATLCSFVESLLLEETCPTMNFPEEVKQRFVKDVMDRFRNPTLKHQLISISLNSTSKFVSRLLPTLKDFQKSRGELPKRIVFGLTCLIRFYKGEFNGIEIPVNDNPEVLAFFKVNWSRLVTDEINIETMVGIILGNSSIWGEDLNGIPELTRTVSDQLNALDKNGVAHVLKIL
ncbi:MAG: tagaturonate reductase, partial [Flavobacteriaceae bacterium]